MVVLSVERGVCVVAGRPPFGQCEAPVSHTRDKRGKVTTQLCNGFVRDAARMQGYDGPFTRYLCREHGDEYAAAVRGR